MKRLRVNIYLITFNFRVPYIFAAFNFRAFNFRAPYTKNIVPLIFAPL